MSSENRSLEEIRELHKQRDVEGLAAFVDEFLDRIGRKWHIGPKGQTLEEYYCEQQAKQKFPLPPQVIVSEKTATGEDARKAMQLDPQSELEVGDEMEVVTYPRLIEGKSQIRPFFCGENELSGYAEEAFWDLQAPIIKVASEQVHIPFSPALEPLVYPNSEKIVNAIKKTIES